MRLRVNIQYLPDGVGADVGSSRLNRPVFLIGFMGVGKSSVASQLSRMLEAPVWEMDACIEERENLTIPEIFSRCGEDYFREVEHTVLEELGSGPQIISCGGGVPMRRDNVESMHALGVTVLLTAEPETIYERVRHDDNRPLLRGNMNVAYIAQLMEQRRERYEAAADCSVTTAGKSVEELCREILALLRERGICTS